jgi:hypothetical protein
MESPIHQPKLKLHQPFLQFQIVERNFQFLSSAKSKHQAQFRNFLSYLDNFSANFKAVCPPSCTITLLVSRVG